MPKVYDQILVKGSPRYRADKQFVKKENVPQAVLETLTLENIVDENGLEIVQDKGDFGGEDTGNQSDADHNDTSNVEPPVDQSKTGTVQPQGTPAAHATANPPAAAPTNAPTNADVQSMPAPVSADGYPGTPAALPSVPEGNALAVANTPARKFVSKTPQTDPGMDFPRKNGKTVDVFDGTTPHTHVRLVAGHMVPLSAENYRVRTDAEIEQKLVELGKPLIDFNEFEDPGSANRRGSGIEGEDGEEDLV